MKNMRRRICTILVFVLAFTGSYAQDMPFYKEIQAFKQKDAAAMPPKNAILFTGSSSFTKWTDVQDYFPGYPIINRGFGGSSLPDVIRYANDVIFPYQPKQVVIYCGENDLAASDTVTAETVVQRVKTLVGMIRSKLGDTPVLFVSLKPSPSRSRLFPKMQAANAAIKTFLGADKHAVFADVYTKMLDKDGEPMKDIFLADSLHMNAKGYAIWQKVLAPLLIK
ncbi:MAG: GDSL-type esterase/lipase family protein [Chitinophagaceae bacterium]